MSGAHEKKPRRRLRFGLRSLLLLVLLVTSAGGLWYRWEPWCVARISVQPDGGSLSVLQSGDGTRIVAWHEDGSCGLMNEDGKPLNRIGLKEEHLHHLIMIPRVHRAVLFLKSGAVVLYDLRDHQKVADLGWYDAEYLYKLAVSGNAERIAWLSPADATNQSDSRKIRIFEAGKGTGEIDVGVLEGLAPSFLHFDYVESGLFVAFRDGKLKLWSSSDHEVTKELELNPAHIQYARSVLGSPCLVRVETVGKGLERKQFLWNTSDNVLRQIEQGEVLSYLPERHAVRTYGQGAIRDIHLESGSIETVMSGLPDNLMTIRFFPEIDRLVTADTDFCLRIWDTERNRQVEAIQLTYPIDYVITCRDGRSFLTEEMEDVVRRTRRRPEYWWGIFWLWETWAVMVFGVGLIASLYRDRRRFREQQGEG